MIIRGGGGGGLGGCINVPGEHFLYVTERCKRCTCCQLCQRLSPQKVQVGPSQPQTKNPFTKTKTYHFRGRLWDKSYRTIVAGTQQMDGTWKHLKKWRPPSMLHKKNKTCIKKGTLGPTAGHGVTTLPCCRLWLLRCHKRSGTASVEKRKKLEE